MFRDAISMPWCTLPPELFSLSRLHWTNIIFLLCPLVYGSFSAYDPLCFFSPSVLLVKSKTLLTNFQIFFLPFENSCIQFLTSYLEESTTTSFVKGIWIKFKVSATDSDSHTANTTDYSKSAQLILGCHTDWFQDQFVFVLYSCHCWCLAIKSQDVLSRVIMTELSLPDLMWIWSVLLTLLSQQRNQWIVCVVGTNHVEFSCFSQCLLKDCYNLLFK